MDGFTTEAFLSHLLATKLMPLESMFANKSSNHVPDFLELL